MGNSSWTAVDNVTGVTASMAYASNANLRSNKRLEDIFVNNTIQKTMDPIHITFRESRDSEANPNSLAIILGLDVTGSMGMIADDMAKRSLGVLMDEIHKRKNEYDPHIMIMGIGDVEYDQSFLQVSQFEADLRIDDELQKLHIEKGGGGNNSESYNLAWWFAANKTKIDCWEKRSQKGLVFTIGDELPPPEVSKTSFRRLSHPVQADIDSKELLLEAQKTYDVFHIIVEEGSYALSRKKPVIAAWTELLGKRALPLSDYKRLPVVILSAIEVNQGADPLEVANSWQDKKDKVVVLHAFGLDKQ
jgi:hypothetical protein